MRTIAGTSPATTTPAAPTDADGLVLDPSTLDAPARLRTAQQDLAAGRVRAALSGFETLTAPGEADDLPTVRTAALAGLGDARLARGDLAGSVAAAQRAEAVARAHARVPGGTTCATWAAWAAGERDAAHGQSASALRQHEEVGRLLRLLDAPREPAVLPWRVSAAFALIRTGQLTRADVLGHQHLTIAETAGSAVATAQALRVLAIADVTGRREELLRRAHDTLTGVAARRLAAQVDCDLAGMLLLRGRGGEAGELLRAVEHYAAGEDLWPLRTRARRLIERGGGSEEGRVWGEVERLTSAERRVVDLAVERLTNREVAARLEVSVKAVEWHLSRVYRKLGIASRADLVRLLGRPV